MTTQEVTITVKTTLNEKDLFYLTYSINKDIGMLSSLNNKSELKGWIKDRLQSRGYAGVLEASKLFHRVNDFDKGTDKFHNKALTETRYQLAHWLDVDTKHLY